MLDKQTAIQMFGSMAAIARACGIGRSAVHQWPDPIPEPRASQVRERARALGLMRGNTPRAHVTISRRVDPKA